MWIKSLRWKLVLWLALLLGCILLGFGLTAYQLYRTNEINQIDQELRRRVAAINSVLHGPMDGGALGRHGRFGERHDDSFDPPPHRGPHGNDLAEPPHHPPRHLSIGGPNFRLPPSILELFEPSDTNGFYYTIWSSDDQVISRSSNAPGFLPPPERTETAAATASRSRGAYREVFHVTAPGERILVGRWIGPDLQAMHQFGYALAAAGLGVLALGLGGVWQLASHTVRPVDDIAAAAKRIAAGNLSERMDASRMDSELGRLAEILNATFTQLEAAFALQKQFTADASHELRTPIAVLISETQTTLARDRTAAEYRETVESCLETAQQMRRITESLLQLARLDAGQEKLRTDQVDLTELAETCAGRLSTLAQKAGIDLNTELQPAQVLGDPDRIAQVILNLITNAIQYNRPQGRIQVRTHTEPGAAVLEVADTGQGIAAKDLPLIFDRFYRADVARGASGRTGLGLAISKAIVEALGGKIEVQSVVAEGTSFQVRFPRALGIGASPSGRKKNGLPG